MGNKLRADGELFRYEDFAYEIADMLFVLILAKNKAMFGDPDPGMQLSGIRDALLGPFKSAEVKVGKLEPIDLARLYPVAEGLLKPRSEGKGKATQWIEKKGRSYCLSQAVSISDVDSELQQFVEVLKSLLNYVEASSKGFQGSSQ